MISRCQRILEENKHAQGQPLNVTKLSKTIATLASDLAQTHIESHPELQALLDHNGAPSLYTIKNPTISAISSLSGSQQTRPSTPDGPWPRRPSTSSEVAPPSEVQADIPIHLPPSVETPAHGENPHKPTIYVRVLDHASESRPSLGSSEHTSTSASSQSTPRPLRHARLTIRHARPES